MKVTCPVCKRHFRLRKSRNMHCVCGHVFSFSDVLSKERVFLLDANVFLYALNNDPAYGRDCMEVLLLGSVATTEQVLAEVHQEVKPTILIYKIKALAAEIQELQATSFKQPSAADLSLLQAALDHPEVGGIITYDADFKAIATAGFIQSKSCKSSSEFWVGTAREFLKRMKK
jgi:predicted nucleic acid-binding protein